MPTIRPSVIMMRTGTVGRIEIVTVTFIRDLMEAFTEPTYGSFVGSGRVEDKNVINESLPFTIFTYYR